MFSLFNIVVNLVNLVLFNHFCHLCQVALDILEQCTDEGCNEAMRENKLLDKMNVELPVQ